MHSSTGLGGVLQWHRNTCYANLRRKNGQEEPYNTWGPWQDEQMTKEEYAHKAYHWRKFLSCADKMAPLLGITIPSSSVYSLPICTYPPVPFHLSTCTVSTYIHPPPLNFPMPPPPWQQNALLKLHPPSSTSQESKTGFLQISSVPPSQSLPYRLCPQEQRRRDGLHRSKRQRDLTSHDHERRHHKAGHLVSSVPVLSVYAGLDHQCAYLLVYISYGVYEGDTFPKWIRGVKDTPWLDVSATLVDDGDVNVAVVNIHEKKGMETKVDGPSGEVSVFTVTGDSVTSKQYELEARSWCYGEYLGWKWFIHVH
ncbi:uncharacterized protein ATNIH1004_001050 [Aspergillus tanneri]|uniref:Uncharacterized protein n=1 Tax=Aspergillus tanneri TaxID=1220188 RepID=A0A5M9N1I8_9EURO|nr:uncharacterized protein ATNIH1004_001050 [Aspergillus tanneri]KAA8652146.1 hypothetical protein ATNIH1004_001050 [Aspergillus tanneri]